MSNRSSSDRMQHPPASKRPRNRSPVVLPHPSTYLCAPPSHSVTGSAAVAGGHYGIQMAAMSGYDTIFHGQPFIQGSGDQRLDQRYRDVKLVQNHRPTLISSFRPSEQLDRDHLRTVYLHQSAMLPPHSSSSLPHQQPLYPAQPTSSQALCPPGHGGHVSGAQLAGSSGIFELPLHTNFKRVHASDVHPTIPRDLMIPLKVDIDSKKPELSGPYNPQVEAISPTLPNDELRDEIKQSKDELLQSINRIDREIAKNDQAMSKLRLKQEQLEKEVKPPKDRIASPDQSSDFKHQSIAQIIYNENKRKVSMSHDSLNKFGEATLLPRYYQPADAAVCQDTMKKFMTFKKHLIILLKKRQHACQIRERYLTDRYDQLIQTWAKKMERIENSAKKRSNLQHTVYDVWSIVHNDVSTLDSGRAKDSKMRECFEKVFPELRKQREDKEKLQTRLTTCGSRMPGYACSEASVEQIADNLHLQEEEERKMFNLAVIPPMMLDARQRSHRFHNENGLITDPLAVHNETMFRVQFWSPEERETFKEKYVVHPKNFGYIGSALENKTVEDCVLFYYLSKKGANYKQLVRRHLSKRRVKAQKVPRPEKTEDTEDQLSASNIDKLQPQILDQSSSASATALACEHVIEVSCVVATTEALESSEKDSSEPSMSTVLSETENGVAAKNASSKSDIGGGGGEPCEMQSATEKLDAGESLIHECALCHAKIEHYGLSRPLTKATCEVYGLNESELVPDMRVCNSCRCKSIHKKYMQCQLPSCKSARRKVKQLRALPSKFVELPEETRNMFMADIQLSVDSVRCCSSCFNRVSRLINSIAQDENGLSTADSSAEMAKWTDEELEKLKEGINQHSKDWAAISLMIGTKTEECCRDLYLSSWRKLGLEAPVVDNEQEKHGDGFMGDASCKPDDDVVPSDDEIMESDEDMMEESLPDTGERHCIIDESSVQPQDVLEKDMNVVIADMEETSDKPLTTSLTDDTTGGDKRPVDNNGGDDMTSCSPLSMSQSNTGNQANNDSDAPMIVDDIAADSSETSKKSMDDGDSTQAISVRNGENLNVGSDSLSVGCVRDLINSAIEKNLQESDHIKSVDVPVQRHPRLMDQYTLNKRLEAEKSNNDSVDVVHDLTTRSRLTSSSPTVSYPGNLQYIHSSTPPSTFSRFQTDKSVIEAQRRGKSVVASSERLSPFGVIHPDRQWGSTNAGLPRETVYNSKASAGLASAGPPPLIHESSRSMGGSIVLGTPLNSDQRRRHHQQQEAAKGSSSDVHQVAMISPRAAESYARDRQPDILIDSMTGQSFSAKQVATRIEPGSKQNSSSPNRQTPAHQASTVTDFGGTATSRDLLLSDYMTAQQMHQGRAIVSMEGNSMARDRFTDQLALSPDRTSSITTWPYILMGERESSPLSDNVRLAAGHGSEWNGPSAGFGAPPMAVIDRPSPRHRGPNEQPQNATRISAPVKVNQMPTYLRVAQAQEQREAVRLPIHSSGLSQRDSNFSLDQYKADQLQPHALNYQDMARISARERNSAPDMPNVPTHNSQKNVSPTADNRSSAVSFQNCPEPLYMRSGTGSRNSPSVVKEPLTAASLIDAIIIEQINHEIVRGNAMGNSQPCEPTISHPTEGGILDRIRASETPRTEKKGRSPPTQVDMDRNYYSSADPCNSPTSAGSKRIITLGEHIDSIILHDYTGRPASSKTAEERAIMQSYVNDPEMDSIRYIGKTNRTHAVPDGLERYHIVGPSSFPTRVPGAPAVPEQPFSRSNVPVSLDAVRQSPNHWYSSQSQYSPRRHQLETSLSRHAAPSANSSSQFSPYSRQHQHDDKSRFTSVRGGANKGIPLDVANRMKGGEGPLAEPYPVLHTNSTHWKAKLSRNHEMEKLNASGQYDKSGIDTAVSSPYSTNERHHATFDVVRSPASFAPDEREVLRLSIGVIRNNQGRVPEGYDQLPMLVKSASPGGGCRDGSAEYGSSNGSQSSIAASHQTMTNLLTVRSSNPNELTRRNKERESPSQHAAPLVGEYGRDTDRERHIYYAASPAGRHSPQTGHNERSQSRQQLSPFYSNSTGVDRLRLRDGSSHGGHMQPSGDRKRSPHPLVSIPPMSSVESAQKIVSRHSTSGPPSPVLMHPKHHWRSAAYGVQWPQSTSGRPDHRPVGTSHSPRSDSRGMAYDIVSVTRSDGSTENMILGHCTAVAPIDRQKYESGISERRAILRETEPAVNYGTKHMSFESMDLSSGDRSNPHTPSSEPR